MLEALQPAPAERLTPVPAAAKPLRMIGVSKSFRQGGTRVTALRDATLSINPGEFVALMGASGSGKSTLLHLAAGLTRPDAGQVLVDDANLAGLGDRQLTEFRRRRIGLVFQAFNLVPSLSAEDNILLPVLTDGRQPPAAEFDALLRRLGIDHRRKHRPDAMSGGEQQRVALARALIANPALILADEPTGSLDSVTGQSICRLLQDMCLQEGRTIIVVTHEPAVAIWAQRVLVMKDGQLLSEFSAAEFPDPQALAAHYQRIASGISTSVLRNLRSRSHVT